MSEQSNAAESLLFDRAELLKRLGDEGALSGLVAIFRKTLAPLIASLKTELTSEDSGAERTAHQIKGMLLNLMATRLVPDGQILEDACASADWAGARETFATLQARLEELDSQLGL